MEDHPLTRAAPEPGHPQGVLDQAGLHVWRHTPAHHLAAEQVNDRGQVQPPLIGGDIGDVSTPELIRRLRGEPALHQIGGHRQVMFAVSGGNKLTLGARAQAMPLHQATHPLLAHPDAAREQLLMHAGPTIFLLDLGMDGAQVGQHGLIALASTGAGAS